jgi:hypothetical protein
MGQALPTFVFRSNAIPPLWEQSKPIWDRTTYLQFGQEHVKPVLSAFDQIMISYCEELQCYAQAIYPLCKPRFCEHCWQQKYHCDKCGSDKFLDVCYICLQCKCCSEKAVFPQSAPQFCENCWRKKHFCEKCGRHKFKTCTLCL